jgi:predicted pyridoxine 5'-phosphate oxidase superfamily flavin-nucleotide-binding protein
LDSLYGDSHRALQDEFGTTRLADFLDKHHVQRSINEQDRGFIESRDMFFLSTVDAEGNPTVSYKGGPTGVVTVLGENEIAFPGYDGNGMFLSMGNITGQGKIGMLFIDFETPHRLRLQGVARLVKDDPLLAEFPEAQYVVRVAVESVWVNCPRYIHRYTKAEQSRYVPKSGTETPLAQWKRLDFVQPVIADEDRAKVAEQGELDLAAYGELVARGEA